MRRFFGGSPTPSGFDPASQLGVQEPIGFWDPLGAEADRLDILSQAWRTRTRRPSNGAGRWRSSTAALHGPEIEIY